MLSTFLILCLSALTNMSSSVQKPIDYHELADTTLQEKHSVSPSDVYGSSQNPYIIVTNTADDTSLNTLRSAILYANLNPGPDTIVFTITDGTPPFVIDLVDVLPVITDCCTVIDATIGNYPGDIQINGSNTPYYGSQATHTLHLKGFKSEVYGLTIFNSVGNGITVEADSCRIGAPGKGNSIFNNGKYPHLSQSNIFVSGTNGVRIQSNFIGISFDKTIIQGLKNNIALSAYPKNVFIGGSRALGEGNIVAAGIEGIKIQSGFPKSTYIQGNAIGTDWDASTNWGNEKAIQVPASTSILIGGDLDHGNIFAFNDIAILEPSTFYPVSADISHNQFICNKESIYRDGENTYPIIKKACPDKISGTALPGSRVELFTYDNSPCLDTSACQGYLHLATVYTLATGRWEADHFDIIIQPGQTVTATATPPGRPTSKFSPCTTVENTTCIGPPDTIYVNASAHGENTGTDWENAFTNLQTALETAQKNDKIWVAQGIYYPSDTADQLRSFSLFPGISVYGGFSGTEKNLEDRNWRDNITILSGDLGNQGDSLDNSMDIIKMIDTDSTTLLDGFYIQHGYSSGNFGGALSISQGFIPELKNNPIIKNCIFRYNFGNTVKIYTKTYPKFYNTEFRENQGGVVIAADNSYPIFTNCSFIKSDGKAFSAEAGEQQFINCIFSENNSAISLNDTAKAYITNCTFWGHKNGTVISCPKTCDAYISNAIFQDNAAPFTTWTAGGIHLSYSLCQINYLLPQYYALDIGPGFNNQATAYFIDPEHENFSPHPCSGAINRGNNAAIPASIVTDFSGENRIISGTVDMGAIEFPGDSPCRPLVTDTCYSCPGALKIAVDMANSHEGADTVKFNLTGPVPYIFRFEPGFQLWDDSTIVDATTQPGWELGQIKVDGSPFNYCTIDSSGGSFDIIICNFGKFNTGKGLAFHLAGRHCGLYGIEFKGFQRYAIAITGDYAQIGSPGRGNIFATKNPYFAIMSLSKSIMTSGRSSCFQSNQINLPFEGRGNQEIILGGDRFKNEGNIFESANLYFANGFGDVPTTVSSYLSASSKIAGNTFRNTSVTFSNQGNPPWAVLDNLRIGGPGGHANIFENCSTIFESLIDSTGRMTDLIPDQNIYQCSPLNPNSNGIAVDSAFSNAVYGNAGPYDSIQVYLVVDSMCNQSFPCTGSVFIGKTRADANGLWKYDVQNQTGLPAGERITALATDTSSNSTGFAPCRQIRCPTINLAIDTTLCYGQTLSVAGKTYSTSGTYTDTLLFYGACPGPVQVNIEILPEKITTIDTTICTGDTLLVNGQAYTTAVAGALEVIPFVGPFRCDSNVVIHLAVRNIPDLLADTELTITTLDTVVLAPLGVYEAYSWFDGTSDPTFTLIGGHYAPGTYLITLSVTDSLGCSKSDTIRVKIDFAVGQHENYPGEQAVFIYPNPTSGDVYLVNRSAQSLFQAKLVNLQGRIMAEIPALEPNTTAKLTLTHFPPGLYILHWQSSGGTGVFQVLII